MAGLDPAEKCLCFGDLVCLQRRWLFLQVIYDVAYPLQHRLPIGASPLHILQHPFDLARQLVQGACLRLAVYLELREGLRGPLVARTGWRYIQQLAIGTATDFDNGMDGQMYGRAMTIERHGNRVHQEGHIVGDDLYDSVRGLPAVFFGLRVINMHFGFARRALPRELPMGQRGPAQVENILVGQVLG